MRFLLKAIKILLKKVDKHINSYKELEVKFNEADKTNKSLVSENAQLKADKEALEEAIRKDIEKKE